MDPGLFGSLTKVQEVLRLAWFATAEAPSPDPLRGSRDGGLRCSSLAFRFGMEPSSPQNPVPYLGHACWHSVWLLAAWLFGSPPTTL